MPKNFNELTTFGLDSYWYEHHKHNNVTIGLDSSWNKKTDPTPLTLTKYSSKREEKAHIQEDPESDPSSSDSSSRKSDSSNDSKYSKSNIKGSNKKKNHRKHTKQDSSDSSSRNSNSSEIFTIGARDTKIRRATVKTVLSNYD